MGFSKLFIIDSELLIFLLLSDMSKRRAWSSEEKDACMRHFSKCLAIGSLPGKKEITEIQSKVECLDGRTWVQIKNFIRNLIKKR